MFIPVELRAFNKWNLGIEDGAVPRDFQVASHRQAANKRRTSCADPHAEVLVPPVLNITS
jgi:hypothetical protein